MSRVKRQKKDFFMIFGVICEFNPFHDGHKHLLNSIKKSENDIVVLAMSGNFVQRGEFAVYNKYDRARVALEKGADLVIEIPSICSTLSAQGFARAGVNILESTGIVDTLAFGAECEDINELKRIAKEIIDRDSEIKEELKKGVSYPSARKNVIGSPIIDSPNNILAIEYLTYTKLNAIAIKRIGKGHDSDDVKYSASEIRKHLDLSEISTMKNCESAILYKLRNMNAEDLKQIDDVSEGLENRIIDAVKTSSSLDELYDKIKTKRYTHSRIRRIILRAYLGITKDCPKEPQYLHILGFNSKGKDILAQMKKVANLPIISKYSDIEAYDDVVKELFNQECKLTDIYNLGFNPPKPCGTERTQRLITINP